MGSSIGFFLGSEDHQALQVYAESIGLVVVAPLFTLATAPMRAEKSKSLCFMFHSVAKTKKPSCSGLLLGRREKMPLARRSG